MAKSRLSRSWPRHAGLMPSMFRRSTRVARRESTPPCWSGLWAPKGTPTDIIAKINSAIVEAFTSASVRQRFEDFGQDIPSIEQQTPQALAAHQKAEIE